MSETGTVNEIPRNRSQVRRVVKTDPDFVQKYLEWRPVNKGTVVIYSIYHQSASSSDVVNSNIGNFLRAGSFDLSLLSISGLLTLKVI